MITQRATHGLHEAVIADFKSSLRGEPLQPGDQGKRPVALLSGTIDLCPFGGLTVFPWSKPHLLPTMTRRATSGDSQAARAIATTTYRR